MDQPNNAMSYCKIRFGYKGIESVYFKHFFLHYLTTSFELWLKSLAESSLLNKALKNI